MDKLKAPWKWDDTELKDNRGNVVLSADGLVSKDNAAMMEAAPLLLKGCCRAYKLLMSSLKRHEENGVFMLDGEVMIYKGILEHGLSLIHI